MITMLVVLAVIGTIVFLIEQIPMSPPFKIVIRVLAILFALLYILRVLGIGDVPPPRL